MSVELFGWAPPNAEVFVRQHLLPLADDPKLVAWKPWGTDLPLPYRWVRRVAGSDDENQYADFAVVRVHTIAAKYAMASQEADRTHQRMRLLVDDPLYDVVMPNGRIADLEYCETLQGPIEVPYSAETVATRFVSEYRLALSISAA